MKITACGEFRMGDWLQLRLQTRVVNLTRFNNSISRSTRGLSHYPFTVTFMGSNPIRDTI